MFLHKYVRDFTAPPSFCPINSRHHAPLPPLSPNRPIRFLRHRTRIHAGQLQGGGRVRIAAQVKVSQLHYKHVKKRGKCHRGTKKM